MKFDSDQISHNMLVQNMPSLAVAIVVAREKNIEKNHFFQNFMKHPNIIFAENNFFIMFKDVH